MHDEMYYLYADLKYLYSDLKYFQSINQSWRISRLEIRDKIDEVLNRINWMIERAERIMKEENNGATK